MLLLNREPSFSAHINLRQARAQLEQQIRFISGDVVAGFCTTFSPRLKLCKLLPALGFSFLRALIPQQTRLNHYKIERRGLIIAAPLLKSVCPGSFKDCRSLVCFSRRSYRSAHALYSPMQRIFNEDSERLAGGEVKKKGTNIMTNPSIESFDITFRWMFVLTANFF